MACVREEMNLLAELDGSAGAGDVELYAARLNQLLAGKAAAIADLQLKLQQYRKMMAGQMV